MTSVANRRSMMGLYSGNTCIRSHQVRIVLAEKGILTEINNVEGSAVPEDLMALNPYVSLPTLIDRELILYDSRVIVEYLDERYPHPPLMPVSPVDRAKLRLGLATLERDIVEHAVALDLVLGTRSENAHRKKLKSLLVSSADLFGIQQFFLSDDFTIVDCVIAPILWRLDLFGIELSDDHKLIKTYMERIFSRKTFRESMTEDEEEMRPDNF
jgi:RNA polymerase-associated protein